MKKSTIWGLFESATWIACTLLLPDKKTMWSLFLFYLMLQFREMRQAAHKEGS